MAEFAYREMIDVAHDDVPFKKLTGDHVSDGEVRRAARS